MSTTVFITDKEHKFYNQRLEGCCIFYDYQYTGSSPDLYTAKTPEGNNIRLLSTQIDTEDYENQLFEEQRLKLNAKEGDRVLIKKTGSGTSSKDFNNANEYIIQKISSSGNVTFIDDNGKFAADFFRPIVEVVQLPF